MNISFLSYFLPRKKSESEKIARPLCGNRKIGKFEVLTLLLRSFIVNRNVIWPPAENFIDIPSWILLLALLDLG